MKQRVLFICSQNMLRSPTAEEVFSPDPKLEVTSAGNDIDAENPVSAEVIEWADTIVAMEHYHRRKLEERFPAKLRGKNLHVPGIRDDFQRMDPKLIQKLHATSHIWKRVPEDKL